MSDYMFMLESHLSGPQAKVLAAVRELAEQANSNVFLTGGAMRDMLGGFPIRDLDFTIEGPAVKFAKELAAAHGAEVLSVDELRKTVELRFPGPVSASLGMARQENYAKPGGKPQVSPATIYEDLHGRDFTVDAIALSVGKASRGLLLDPTNGLGDLQAKELRTVNNQAFYNDPSRILRLFRLRARLGFTVAERTQSQYANVREAKLDSKIPAATLLNELRKIAAEPAGPEIIRALDEEGLMQLFTPAWSGAKLNLAGFQKMQKAVQSLLPVVLEQADWFSLTLFLLFEKLSPKERTQALATLGLDKAEADHASKLEARAKKVEKELAAARITRPSTLYNLLSGVPEETLLFLLFRSSQRTVGDRIRNYFQKYRPLALEVTDDLVVASGGVAGTAKFAKLKQQMINARLDARPKKPPVEEAPPPPPPAPSKRQSSSFARSIT